MARIEVSELDHIVLRVADVERLEEFRRGAVGFPSVRITGDTLIDIVAAKDGSPVHQERNLDHFCLVIEPTDLTALVAELQAGGITVVTQPVSRWGAHGRATSIYILDPDGNEVELRYY